MKTFLNKHIVKIFIALFVFDFLLMRLSKHTPNTHLSGILLLLFSVTIISGIILQLVVFFATLLLIIFTKIITEKRTYRYCLGFIIINAVLIIFTLANMNKWQ